jgi:hypothetical protein
MDGGVPSLPTPLDHGQSTPLILANDVDCITHVIRSVIDEGFQ